MNGTSVYLSHETNAYDRLENFPPVTVVNTTFLEGDFLSGWHTPGHYRVNVTNPDGQKGSTENLFILYDGISTAPVISDLSPVVAPNNTHPVLPISGDYLSPPVHVLLQNESGETVRENATPVYDPSSGTVNAAIDLQGLPYEDGYNIRVINMTSEAFSDVYRFTVDPPDDAVPFLDSITPNSGVAGSMGVFSISGTNIAMKSDINLSRPGRTNISAIDVYRYGSDVVGYLPLPLNASPGFWNVTASQNGLFSNDNLRYLISASPESVYTITAVNGTGGMISPSGDVQVPIGTNQSFTVIPDPGCHLVTVVADGAPVGQVLNYTFSNVTDNHIIHAAFAKDQGWYAINATADPWTKLYPSGNGTYPRGSNQTFISQAKPEADLSDIIVDSESKGALTHWTFAYLNTDHTISARGDATLGQVHVLFSATPRFGMIPLEVSFTSDQSLGRPTAWYWQLGDGETSTTQNPHHTYAAPGTYPVSLRATNNQTGGYGIWNNFITVTDRAVPEPTPVPVPGTIVVQFSADPALGTAPATVTFTDLSTGNPTSWNWDFGDGNYSVLKNQQHLYTAPGSYEVTLSVSNEMYSGRLAVPGSVVLG